LKKLAAIVIVVFILPITIILAAYHQQEIFPGGNTYESGGGIFEVYQGINRSPETFRIDQENSTLELGATLLTNEIHSQQNLLMQSAMVFQMIALLFIKRKSICRKSWFDVDGVILFRLAAAALVLIMLLLAYFYVQSADSIAGSLEQLKSYAAEEG
jgi:hypothetical protein